MQISGRLIIAVVLILAVALSGGAWLYQYSYSRHAAAFWGAPAARLIVKAPRLALLELAPWESGDAEESTGDEPEETKRIAGQPIVSEHDLSSKPGLIHLRHVFTQDSNFDWNVKRREPASGGHDWGYALRFSDGDQQLIVLLDHDFELLGKFTADGTQIDLIPCPRLASSLVRYLTDVGALPASTPAD